MYKSKFFITMVSVFLGLFITIVCSTLATAGPPIKIGLLVPLSGPYSKAGQAIERGFRMRLDEAGYKVADREIKVLVEDTEAKPATAISKAKKLWEANKVDFITGTFSSAVTLAVRDYIHERKIPFIVLAGGFAMSLSYEKKSPYLYRCGNSSGQYFLGFPTYLSNEKGYKTMVIMVPDYSYGWDTLKVVKTEFTKAGGRVVQEMKIPFPTMDFGPYLAKINTTASCVLAEFAGADAVRLVQQYKEYRMWDKLPLVGGGIIAAEFLKTLGDAGVGIIGPLYYSPWLDTPEAKKYFAAFKSKYGEPPSEISSCAYDAGKAILLALDKIRGNIVDREAFLSAFSKVDFMDGVRGRFRFEADTNCVITMSAVREVIKKDGEYIHKILKVIQDTKASDVRKLLEAE